MKIKGDVMLRRNPDPKKNYEISKKSTNGKFIFVGFGEVVDVEIEKETKKFIYYADGMRVTKETI